MSSVKDEGFVPLRCSHVFFFAGLPLSKTNAVDVVNVQTISIVQGRTPPGGVAAGLPTAAIVKDTTDRKHSKVFWGPERIVCDFGVQSRRTRGLVQIAVAGAITQATA